MSYERVTHDKHGLPVYRGDYVKCMVSHFKGIDYNENRRVQEVLADGKIVLRNNYSPVGTSPYDPINFVRITKHNKAHKENNVANMLHMAIMINGVTYEEIAHAASKGVFLEPSKVMADTSADAIKEKIRVRISAHPEERWLILSGNTIGEIASPPVRFRTT